MSFERLTLPPYNEGQLLLGIFKYQNHIMEEYQRRGSLPYNVDLETKEGHLFLKKNIYWVIEELMEAKEAYDNLMEEYLKNGTKDMAKLKELLDKYFCELADAMHFMVELFIFSGIDAEDIQAYYIALCEERRLEILIAGDALPTSFNYAQQTNNFDDGIRIEKYKALTLPAFKESIKVSEEVHNYSKLCTLEVVAALAKAGNLLKKREWKLKEDEPTPIQAYHYKLMEAWLFFFKLQDLVGLDAVSAYHYYETMNIKNQERILNNY